MRWAVFVAGAGVALLAQSSQELPADVLLLARIKLKMAENLTRLPNYTCTQTIERSRRRAPSRRFELVDTLRLEVAVVAGKEMFSWPGENRFEDRELSKMAPGGAIGNGNFALHARSVFLSKAATFTFVGERIRDGRRTIRFDYIVPLMHSGYLIRIGETKAIVGYQGAFWADAETLDLSRLEVQASEIPPSLPVSAASDAMEYHRVTIGAGEFLLPLSSELILVDLTGNESRNRVRFSACRQYSGDSTISFGEAPEDAAATAKPAIAAITLPADLDIEMALIEPITSGQSAIGDSVRAQVTRTVKRRGSVLVPRGAIASGRIVELKRQEGRYTYYVVTLRFDLIEFDGTRATMEGRLTDAGLLPSSSPARTGSIWRNPAASSTQNDSSFAVTGDRLRLERGFRLVWRTSKST